MNVKKKEIHKRGSINLILLGMSLMIFGGLGLIFMTQMELLAGWSWTDYENKYPVRLNLLEADDVNDDDISEILCYARVDHERDDGEIEKNIPNFGAILLLDGRTGEIIEEEKYDEDDDYTVANVICINDINDDDYNDFFVCKAEVKDEFDHSGEIEIIENECENFIISGEDLDELEDDFTNLYVKDVLVPEDTDNVEDIICLECYYNESNGEQYELRLTGYSLDGTIIQQNSKIEAYSDDPYYQESVPNIELFEYGDDNFHMLAITDNFVYLVNLSSPNYSKTLWTYDNKDFNTQTFLIIKDLTSDDIQEIIIISNDGDAIVLDGSNGNVLQEFEIASSDDNVFIQEIPNDEDDSTYIVADINQEDDDEIVETAVYLIEESDNDEVWKKKRKTEQETITIVLDDDLDGDDINDLIIHEEYQPYASQMEVHRLYIISAVNNDDVLGIMNLNNAPRRAIIFSDIDGDGIKDIAYTTESRIVVMSAKDPIPIWRSPEFPIGFPLFIMLIAFLSLGILILILKSKTLQVSLRKSIKENKMSFIIISVVLILISTTFIIFIGMINVFNASLILNDEMTHLIISFLLITILWYGLLPLIAAIYNQFSPRFAYSLIKIRKLFFKFTRSTNHDIIVGDLGDRYQLGNFNKIKRVILPLLLSIAMGFYSYNFFAPILGYPQGFTLFGSNDFFDFIVGYVLLCTLPMLLSFLIFSFLISGNFLLDDAGIVYYVESKKYRKPGDVEPISIWSQSLIKGIAGISALYTFGMFFLTVDFSGFFQENLMFAIFGAILIGTMFWGLPFLTALAYILFSVEVMDFTCEHNTQKLYKIMEKHGYDITPHDLTNLYPSGYEPSNKMKKSKLKKTI